MATYGAKYLQWAPFKAEGADISAEAYPKYDEPINLGALVAVTDNIANAEARNYGDNSLQEYVSEFQDLTVDVEVTEMSNAVASKVFGATTGLESDLEYGTEDAAPYGGMGFYVCKQIGTAKKYQGIYYPKLKATRQGATYNTKGQSISFANSKAHFIGTAGANGKYQVFSQDFASESEAKAWVDGKIKATV